MEIYFKGENCGIKKMTAGKFYFNPLFVYKKERGTDIYYEFNNPSTDPESMIQYFVKNPKKFKTQIKKYLNECAKITKLVGSYQIKDLKKLYQLAISVQPTLTLSVVLGQQYGLRNEPLFALAYQLRKKTEKIIYQAVEKLLDSLKQLKPQLKLSIDVLTFNEIYNNKIPSAKVINDRKSGFIYFNGHIYTGISLNDFQKNRKVNILEDKKDIGDGIDIIKGVVAMNGLARGRAKIVFNSEQLNKVKTGDILVAPMTTPNYLSALKRAAAFVTDEGGITCHAAIVAREMKKTCIIGTKIATKVLKDGDLVEVDAKKGIVRKLK